VINILFDFVIAIPSDLTLILILLLPFRRIAHREDRWRGKFASGHPRVLAWLLFWSFLRTTPVRRPSPVKDACNFQAAGGAIQQTHSQAVQGRF
jgi:hypothetical protein